MPSRDRYEFRAEKDDIGRDAPENQTKGFQARLPTLSRNFAAPSQTRRRARMAYVGQVYMCRMGIDTKGCIVMSGKTSPLIFEKSFDSTKTRRALYSFLPDLNWTNRLLFTSLTERCPRELISITSSHSDRSHSGLGPIDTKSLHRSTLH